MIRAVLHVLLPVGLGVPVIWIGYQTPGGGLVRAGVVAVGLLAVVGLTEATTKGR